MSTLFRYLLSYLFLLAIAWVVFRIAVRRDYARQGRLSGFSSFLELFVWGLFMFFPYTFNPPEWVYFWTPNVPVGPVLRWTGLVTTSLGLLLAFGVMFWFGLRRAFGLQSEKLIQSGPYRFSRNPQLTLGVLMIVGVCLLWPSWYALGWLLLYALISHMMVLTEEEHLRNIFGEEYDAYASQVPRYLGLKSKKNASS